MKKLDLYWIFHGCGRVWIGKWGHSLERNSKSKSFSCWIGDDRRDVRIYWWTLKIYDINLNCKTKEKWEIISEMIGKDNFIPSFQGKAMKSIWFKEFFKNIRLLSSLREYVNKKILPVDLEFPTILRPPQTAKSHALRQRKFSPLCRFEFSRIPEKKIEFHDNYYPNIELRWNSH